MKLWHKTSIDISDCYLPGLDMDAYLTSKETMDKHNTFFVEGAGGIWNIPAEEIFNTKFIQEMRQLVGSPIATVNCFMRWPNYQHASAHHDCYEYDGEVIKHGGALNWCWEPDNAEMVWYKLPEGAVPFTEKRRNIEMNVSVDIDDTLEVLDKHVIGQTPTLVNTAEFHLVDMNDRERICLRCRVTWVVTWGDHMNTFRNVLVN